MKQKILIIEEEQNLTGLLEPLLLGEGFEPYKSYSGFNALKEIEKKKPELILMDLKLSDLSGLQLCKKLRDDPKTVFIPIIILSSRKDPYDELNAFEFGCSDYITKPFDEKVLIARIKACLNFKSGHFLDEIIKFQNLEISPSRYEVTIKNRPVKFTPLEFKLLYFLAENKGKVFKRSQIFEHVYENDYTRSDRSIDIIINRVRKKLKTYGELIETVYGVGYRFRTLDAK